MRVRAAVAGILCVLAPAAPAHAVTAPPGFASSSHPLYEGSGQLFTAQLAHSDDCPPSLTGNSSVAWGDGGSSTVTVVPVASGGCDFVGTHSYAEPGTYTITWNGDWYGTNFADGDNTATVYPFNLQTRARKALAGLPVKFGVSFYGGDAKPYSYHVDWGDGTSEDVPVDYNIGASPHVYAHSGTYKVTIDLLLAGQPDGHLETRAVIGDCSPAQTGDDYVPPVADAYDRWLSLMYHDVLRRLPSRDERQQADAALATGAGRADLALALLRGPEAETRWIAATYDDLLGRPPDVGELDRALHDGSTLLDIFGGQEYADLVQPESTGTDGGLLTRWMSCELLGRKATDAEYKLGLGATTRPQAAAAFLASPAVRAGMADDASRAYLRHPLHSSVAGATREAIAADVLGSREYFARANAGGVIDHARIASDDVRLTLRRAAVLRLRILDASGHATIVSLGRHARGAVSTRWSARHVLARGSYDVVVEALSRGRVIDASDPLTLRISRPPRA